MKRNISLIAFLLIISAIFVSIWAVNQNKKSNQVCFQSHCFNVELAKTDEEKDRGLMFKKSLDPDKGMLFIYEKEGVYPFWMENTLIPLDIIWINQNKEIIFINENSRPCENSHTCPSINPYKNARYVLEINGGTAEKIGLKIGDRANF